MKFKKLAVLSLSVIMSASMLVGCGTKSTEENSTASSDIKIGMVADLGGINDESFNQSAWEGLQQAEKDFGIEIKVIESKQASEYLPNMESLIDEDVDMVIGVGYTMKEDIQKQAENYPDTQFVLIDETYDTIPENVTPILFRENEAAYLTGLVAGKMTKTNDVGFIGGIQTPVVSRFEYGYKAGVKEANDKANVNVQYAGTFSDAAKGKSIANQMYGNGSDIILSAAGGTGLGAIESAKEQNKYAIGVDRDQSDLAPENVLVSALKKLNVASYDLAKSLVEGTFKGGAEKVYGIKEGGVGISEDTKNLIPQDVMDYVNKEAEKIKNGEIKVPRTEEEYNQLTK